jgi:hypothetical protein
MKKEKKVSIRYFLNSKLGIEVEGEEHNPLYLQVTFNRKNTQIKSAVNEYFFDMDSLKKKHEEIIEFEKKQIELLVRYLYERDQENFSFKGFAEKLSDLYVRSLYDRYRDSLIKELNQAILRSRSKYMRALTLTVDQKSLAHTLYELACLAIPNLKDQLSNNYKFEIEFEEYFLKEFKSSNRLQGYGIELIVKYNLPTILDWLQGNLKLKFTESLVEKYKVDLESAQKYVKLVQNRVRTLL